MSWRFFPVRELAPGTNQQFQTLAAELNAWGRLIHGEGSPEGRWEAQQGALYQQRDPDQVATAGLLWYKTTPTGNTGWQQLPLAGGGSPEGVVEAGRATLYQQTGPPGNGILWVKTTPSGNTGWQQIV